MVYILHLSSVRFLSEVCFQFWSGLGLISAHVKNTRSTSFFRLPTLSSLDLIFLYCSGPSNNGPCRPLVHTHTHIYIYLHLCTLCHIREQESLLWRARVSTFEYAFFILFVLKFFFSSSVV